MLQPFVEEYETEKDFEEIIDDCDEDVSTSQ